jgi:hypothetical protein
MVLPRLASDAGQAVSGDFLGYLASHIQDAVVWVFTKSATWWLRIPSPDLAHEPAIAAMRQWLLPVTGAVAAGGMVAAGLRMTLSRRANPLLDVGTGLITIAAVATIGVAVPDLLLLAGDSWSSWILSVPGLDPQAHLLDARPDHLQPAAAAVYATAFTMIGKGSNLETLLTGFVMLALAPVALPILMRFFTWTTGTVSSGGGAGALLAGAGAGVAAMGSLRGASGGSGSTSASEHASYLAAQQQSLQGADAAEGASTGTSAAPGGGSSAGAGSGAEAAQAASPDRGDGASSAGGAATAGSPGAGFDGASGTGTPGAAGAGTAGTAGTGGAGAAGAGTAGGAASTAATGAATAATGGLAAVVTTAAMAVEGLADGARDIADSATKDGDQR